jgi:tetratricopeptide (TPR) repeat protein
MKSVGASSAYSGSYPDHQIHAIPKSPLRNTLNLYEICANSTCKILLVKPMRCGGCKQVYYCSQECQKLAWKTHKAACQTITTQTTLHEIEEKKAYPEATPKAKMSEVHIYDKKDVNEAMEVVRIVIEKQVGQVDHMQTFLHSMFFDRSFFTEKGIYEEGYFIALADLSYLVQRLDPVIDLMNKVIEFNPHISILYSVFVGLAHAYELKKDFDKQQQYLEMAFKLNPQNDICTRLFNSLWDQGKLDEAEKFLREVIKLTPKNIDAFFVLGDILYQKKQWNEAEVFMKEVIRLNPKHAAAYNILGKLTMLRGKFTEGITFLLDAISHDDGKAEYQNDYKNLLEVRNIFENVIIISELDQMKSIIQMVVLNSKAFNLLNLLTHQENLILFKVPTIKLQLRNCDNEIIATLLEWITKSDFNIKDLNTFFDSGKNKQLLEQLNKRGFSDDETSRFSQLLNIHVINNR